MAARNSGRLPPNTETTAQSTNTTSRVPTGIDEPVVVAVGADNNEQPPNETEASENIH